MRVHTLFLKEETQMNKRIISLILAFLMLASMLFTGCSAFGEGEETDPNGGIVEEASNSAMTLSMFVVSKEPVSDKTAEKVEAAFNKITKPNFKTQVKLHYATYEEYYQMIEDRVESNLALALLEEEHDAALKTAKKNAKAEGIATDDAWFDAFYAANPDYEQFRETEELTGEDTTAEETELVTIDGIDNSYTLSQIKYPDEKPAQIDIIWIDSYDRYVEYIEREMIERLDSELTGSSKKLNEYINNELLTWAKWCTGGTYGIPNNVIIGEYTYLLVNKELAKKYSYNPEELNTLAKCSDFLADVQKYEPGVAPILGDIYPVNTYYWNIDTATGKINSDKFSVLASTTDKRTMNFKGESVGLICNNIFKSPEFTEQIKTIQKYKDAKYIAAEGSTDNYAIRVIKGDASLAKVYGEEYQLNILEYPRVGYEEVFSNMFAVSTYTRNVARSMQIITYLNTNSDLRNILQYGVEGEHYKIDDETGKLVRLNRDYIMDIESTGNVFMAYPEENMDLDVWEWGKKQNLDVLPYLTLSFDYSDKLEVPEGGDPKDYPVINKSNIDLINTLSADIWNQINNCESLEKLEELIAQWNALEENVTYKDALKAEKSPTGPKEDSNETAGFFYYYSQWLQDTGLYVPKEE
jgi:putative aldouronate transport system substrate-binding protein